MYDSSSFKEGMHGMRSQLALALLCLGTPLLAADKYDPEATEKELQQIGTQAEVAPAERNRQMTAAFSKLSREEFLDSVRYILPKAAREGNRFDPAFAQALITEQLIRQYTNRFGQQLKPEDRFTEVEDKALPFMWRLGQAQELRTGKLSLAQQERMADALLQMTTDPKTGAGSFLPELIEQTEQALQVVQNTIAPGSPTMAHEGHRTARMMPPAESILPQYGKEAQRLQSRRQQLLTFVKTLSAAEKIEAGGRIDWIEVELSRTPSTAKSN